MMSSTRTHTRVRHAANEPIVEMLEERFAEATSTNYKRTLRRALRAIRVYGEPILTKEKALKVPGVGQHIATQIQILLLEQTSQPSQPLMPEPGAVLLPDELDSSQPSTPRRRPRSRTTTRRKEYLPQYRSAPYAIMIALYHAESSGITAMRKDDLARSAQQYCDKAILIQGSDDPSTWYGGWSSVNKTLVPKGLIARGGNPIKFSLSATGRELAERLIEMNNDVLAMGAREYRADGPVDVPINNYPVTQPARTKHASTTSMGGRADAPTVRNLPDLPHNVPGDSQDQSPILCQEEADKKMAIALTRRFAEEDAVPQAEEPVVQPRPQKATRRRVSRPVIDEETASALERKYRLGKEFGAILPGVQSSTPQQTKPASSARRRKLTAAQCDRATRAIQRLEARGYSRVDCIKIVELLHAEGALPRTVDGLYQAVVNALLEAEKQDRRLDRTSERLGLRASELNSGDDKDDSIVGYEGGEKAVPAREPRSNERPVELNDLSSDSILLASNADRCNRTSDPRRLSKSGYKEPVVVIDLDEDGVVDLGRPNTSKKPVHRSPSSNPPKRSRIPDVIAIDSDDDRNPSVPTGAVGSVDVHDCLAAGQAPAKTNTARNSVSLHTTGDNPLVGTTFNKPQHPRSDCMRDSIGESSLPVHHETKRAAIHSNQRHQPAQAEECHVVLLLDSMERFRNSHTMLGHIKGPGDLLLEEGVDCEVRTLPTGDAVFVARFPDESEIVLDYIIERKTVEDYEASMKDGRVARQSYLMRQANIKRRVFLLEGDLKEKEEIYNKAELHKKLAEMTMCSGLYVKHTRDMQDTVHFYASLYRRLQKKFLKQSKEMTLRGRSLFSEWNDRMDTVKKSLTLEQLFMIQLCQIPGLGTTKAQAIIEMGYTTPFLLYKAYKRLDSQEEKDEMLNKGEHAIGGVSSKAVAQLFTQREYPTILKRSPHK